MSNEERARQTEIENRRDNGGIGDAYFGPLVEGCGHNGATEKRLEGYLTRTHTFQQWLAQNLSASHCAEQCSPAVRIVRHVLAEIESTHALEHFHFKVQNPFDYETRRLLPGCTLTVIAGDKPGGPHKAATCMSCDLACSLAVGVGAESVPAAIAITSADALLVESAHTRVWIDAKARPMLIFTPRRHAERLSDLDDVELEDLLRAIHTALTTRGLRTFRGAIANHGDFRNHAHLHVKVRFPPHEFEKCKWSADERQKLARVRAFAASVGRWPRSAAHISSSDLGRILRPGLPLPLT